MEILDKLSENNLIICPSDYKKSILLKLNENKILAPISFISINEYIKNITFDYSDKTILYLMNKYDLSLNNAKEILDNLVYINESKKYDNNKLDNLVKYKKELDKEGLLIYNPIFKSYVSNKNILVYGYGDLDSFSKSLIIGNTVTYINDKEIDKKYSIYNFDSMEEEVEYLYEEIDKLLLKDIDINHICILNASKDYIPYFKRYNSYFNFKIDYGSLDSIIGLDISKKFISMLDMNTKEEIYDYLKNINNRESIKLISILNKYAEYDLKDIKELIINDLSNTKLTDKYINVVKCVDENACINDNDYVFLIGFNDNYPHTRKDNEYLSDNLRGILGLDTLETLNETIKNNTRAYLSNINHLYLSNCKYSPFNKYNNQYLFANVENKEDYKFTYDYSSSLNKLKYAYKLDDLSKYSLPNEDLGKLYYNYDSNDYLDYDNSFNKLNNKEISTIDKVKLSYSSMDDFYKCSFKYYLKHILNISDFKGTYLTRTGTISHGVLEDYFNNSSNFNFNESWNNQKEKIEKDLGEEVYKNSGEKHFEELIKEELKKDIEILDRQKKNGLLDKVACENEKTINLTDKLSFKGLIDKVMYSDDKNALAIIDYKTGKTAKIEDGLMEFGLSLQLPSYLYLVKHIDEFKDKEIIGYYLQYLLNGPYEYDEKKDISQMKEESLKLNGYTINDQDMASLIDLDINSEGTSSTIKGFKIRKKDGEIPDTAKVIDRQGIDDLANLVEAKIKEAYKEISVGNFEINPKVINGKNKSCEYCEYEDICLKRFKDNKYLFTSKEVEDDE